MLSYSKRTDSSEALDTECEGVDIERAGSGTAAENGALVEASLADADRWTRFIDIGRTRPGSLVGRRSGGDQSWRPRLLLRGSEAAALAAKLARAAKCVSE